MPKDLLSKISEKIKKDPEDFQAYQDLYEVASNEIKINWKRGLEYLTWESDVIADHIKNGIGDLGKLYRLHREVLLRAAPWDFDSFLQFVEWNREPDKKFYIPRRKILRGVVRELQRLADEEIKMLCISMPPGTGKSTLAIFFITWMAGKYPDNPILTGSHSNSFVRGTYDECLRIMDEKGEYLWWEVFPNVRVSSTNAKDCRIDLGERKRFETLEFTSIGTGNAGLYRAATLLYCDDLVSGIEVALSKERLDKLWEIYTTDLRQRKIGDSVRELHIATRWSLYDVIGRLETMYGDDPEASFIRVPALDENDKSNFNYPFNKGFSTKFYHSQREIMEEASWKALYMNEPVERNGILFSKDELRRFYELPEEEPDGIIAVCDTKDKGKDYCVLPIAYQYGNEFYIVDFICDNGKPEIVEDRLVETLLHYKVHIAQFESNSAGRRIAQAVQEKVKARGGRTKITTKYTTANKETKIIVNSGTIKEKFLFLDPSKQEKEYRKAEDMLCSYTMAGRNPHDDVPDALSQLAEYVTNLNNGKVEAFARPW